MAIIEPAPNPEPTPRISYSQLRQAFQNVGFKIFKRILQSYNFVTGSAGWQINANGDVEFGSGTFRGSITGSSINIPNATTPLFSVDSSGNAKAIGMSSINMKAFTNFEGSGRFVLTGDVAPTFANNGMIVAPGTVATHYARALWWVSNFVFNNKPTFTCTLIPITAVAGDGVGFVGLGLPTITGSGMTETGRNFCGFELKKTSGVFTIIAIQCDGGGTATFSSTLLTVALDDSVELFLKMNASSIDYYTRVNGGALSAVTTLSATMPTGGENYISFVTSNKGGTDDFKIQFQCAAYEH